MSDYLSISNDTVLNLLEKGLDASAKKHRVISNNIANVDTPNFKRSDVPFLEELKKMAQPLGSLPLITTDKNHISNTGDDASSFAIVKDNSTSLRKDGNNVDIEKETTGMLKNNIFYNSLAQILISKIESLKYSIEEGKR